MQPRRDLHAQHAAVLTFVNSSHFFPVIDYSLVEVRRPIWLHSSPLTWLGGLNGCHNPRQQTQQSGTCGRGVHGDTEAWPDWRCGCSEDRCVLLRMRRRGLGMWWLEKREWAVDTRCERSHYCFICYEAAGGWKSLFLRCTVSFGFILWLFGECSRGGTH